MRLLLYLVGGGIVAAVAAWTDTPLATAYMIALGLLILGRLEAIHDTLQRCDPTARFDYDGELISREQQKFEREFEAAATPK